MKFTDIPTWLHLPIKAVPLICCIISLGAPAASAQVTQTENKTPQIEKKSATTISCDIGKNNGDEKENVVLTGSARQGGPAPDAATNARRVKGIDVSHYQGLINWRQVARTNVKFAFAKATGGKDFVDPRFAENWQGIREADLYRGAYHFFLADDDAQAQAELFVKTIGKLRQNDLPPMLDVETSDHTDLDTLQERVLLWLQLVEKRTGRLPILYTDNGFADRILIDPRFSRYPFWIADYARKVDDLPTPWDKSGWALWQYGENGRAAGIGMEVDMDEFKGSLEDLLVFIKKSQSQ